MKASAMSNKLTNIVTPVGELHFVNITGQGKKNYNEDGFNYAASVHLKGEQAEALIAKIKAELGEVPKGQTVKSLGFRELLEDGEGQFLPTSKNKERQEDAKKTGIFCFTFTTKTTFADGKQKAISVYNSAEPPTKIKLGDTLIGNGSKGAISGKMQRFERGPSASKECGVSLFLNAVQIVDLVAYSGDAGFEGQDGGWTGNDEEFSGSSEAETQSAPKASVKPKL